MRIFKRGKYYWIDFTFQGKRYRRSLKTTRKEVAEQYKAELELKIFRGEFWGIKEIDTTFQQFVTTIYTNYIQTHKSPRTVQTDLGRIKVLIQYFGQYRLHEITPMQVEKFKADLLKEKSPSTVNRYVTLLKAILNFAVKQSVLKVNPLKAISKFKEPPGRVRYLTPEELAKLIEVAPPHLKPIIQVAVFTGLRKSDLLNLKWRDIDFQNRRIKVYVSKTNELRFVPMNDLVQEILQNLPRESEYVFTYRGKPIKSVKTSFQNACIRAGIRNFRFHDLRHTFASYLGFHPL